MNEMWLYQPEGFDWERFPTDLSTAVEQWWEDGEPHERTQVFVEMSCCKISMPDIGFMFERLVEDLCDDTFLDHYDVQRIEKIMQEPDVVAVGEALWELIHSKVHFWQADKVVRKVTVKAVPTGLHTFDWAIVGDWCDVT